MEHFSATAGVFVRQKRNFFAERNFFLAAKTQISCRKEIPGSVESGEKRGFGPPFPSIWDFHPYKIRLTFCPAIPRPADAPTSVVRTSPPPPRQDGSGNGKSVSSCLPATPRESRVSVRAPSRPVCAILASPLLTNWQDDTARKKSEPRRSSFSLPRPQLHSHVSRQEKVWEGKNSRSLGERRTIRLITFVIRDINRKMSGKTL